MQVRRLGGKGATIFPAFAPEPDMQLIVWF
ncbi:MAG: hypothetical protein RL150_246 [Candidatus Parcubacteria bacterium]|jgi:hypothetical protein